MGLLKRIWAQLRAGTGHGSASPSGASAGNEPGVRVAPRVALPVGSPDYVSQAGDVPRVVVAMLERNGNVRVEARRDVTPTGEPCTVHLFRDPLVLSSEQLRSVKKYLTRCQPGRPMDAFAQLGNGGQGDRFVWLDSEDERGRRDALVERAEREREERDAAAALRVRIAAAVRDGTIPPRRPPLSVSSASVRDLGPSPTCEELDDLLESLGVDFLLNEMQPDDVTFRILDRDVLLPRALFERLHEADGALPPGRMLSIAQLWRHWDRYSVADDETYGEFMLARLEPPPESIE